MEFIDKKLLIFDLDGTLIDSVPDLAGAINFTLKNLQREIFSEDTIRKWVGNGSATLVSRALSGDATIDTNLDVELFEKAHKIFLDYYLDHLCDVTRLYANVDTTLQTLKDKGYILTIVTNKPFEFIQPILKTLQIEDYFEYYIGANSLDVKKPNPKPLLHICEKFNIDISSTVMIGDSKNDIEAANRANIESIGLTYGYNYKEPISTHNPTVMVDSFKDILNSLS